MVLSEEREEDTRLRILSRRQQGKSFEEILTKLNEVIRGFANYFRIGNVKSKFAQLDEWIRMRVRSYIRKKR